MEVVSIINSSTGNFVCDYYLNKPLDYLKCSFIEEKPLVIKYKDGSGFTHENIKKVIFLHDGIKIETTKKVWVLKECLK